MQKYKYDILGIGNAVTDIFVEVEDSFLIKNDLVEGTMKLVEESYIKKLLEGLSLSKTLAGGSVANTLSTVSKLGGSCAFIGSRKNDKYGNLFSYSMEEENIFLLKIFIGEGRGCIFGSPGEHGELLGDCLGSLGVHKGHPGSPRGTNGPWCP